MSKADEIEGAHCCRAFFISAPSWLLFRSAEAELAGKPTYRDSRGSEHPLIRDGAKVYGMIKKIGESCVNPITGLAYAESHEWFACRHLGHNGKCRAYDERPQMCKDFTCAQGDGQKNFPRCPSKGTTCFPTEATQ